MAAIIGDDPILHEHIPKLIAMLLVEDGTLTATRRHDCKANGVCFAIGIQGHHICHRGTPLVSQDHGKEKKHYCKWLDTDGDGKYESPLERFEKEYPGFSFDWRIQFKEYTTRMQPCLTTNTINQCIQLWNSREVGRIAKVDSRVPYVIDVLGW